jgi:hypothetical protein
MARAWLKQHVTVSGGASEKGGCVFLLPLSTRMTWHRQLRETFYFCVVSVLLPGVKRCVIEVHLKGYLMSNVCQDPCQPEAI